MDIASTDRHAVQSKVADSARVGLMRVEGAIERGQEVSIAIYFEGSLYFKWIIAWHVVFFTLGHSNLICRSASTLIP